MFRRREECGKGGCVAKQQRIREVFTTQPGLDYLRQRQSDGWRIGAIEWLREAGPGEPEPNREDLPYGMRVAPDCLHLEEDPTEKQAMLLMLELIIQDIRLPEVAARLNKEGFRTRAGSEWSPVAVFDLLPRLIEVGPRIFSSQEWVARRPRLLNVG
jgi:hypothetical protein